MFIKKTFLLKMFVVEDSPKIKKEVKKIWEVKINLPTWIVKYVCCKTQKWKLPLKKYVPGANLKDIWSQSSTANKISSILFSNIRISDMIGNRKEAA